MSDAIYTSLAFFDSSHARHAEDSLECKTPSELVRAGWLDANLGATAN